MHSDILLVREGECFRLLHGHLHLASELGMHDQAMADVKGEDDPVMIRRTPDGLFVHHDNGPLPLRRD